MFSLLSISATLLAMAMTGPSDLHGTTVCPSPEQVRAAVWQQGLPHVDLQVDANRQGPAAGAGGGMLAVAKKPRGRLALALGVGGSPSLAPIRGREPGAAVGLVLLSRARVEPLPVAGQLLLEASPSGSSPCRRARCTRAG